MRGLGTTLKSSVLAVVVAHFALGGATAQEQQGEMAATLVFATDPVSCEALLFEPSEQMSGTTRCVSPRFTISGSILEMPHWGELREGPEIVFSAISGELDIPLELFPGVDWLAPLTWEDRGKWVFSEGNWFCQFGYDTTDGVSWQDREYDEARYRCLSFTLHDSLLIVNFIPVAMGISRPGFEEESVWVRAHMSRVRIGRVE